MVGLSAFVIIYIVEPQRTDVAIGMVAVLALAVTVIGGLRIRRHGRLWPLLRYHHDDVSVSIFGPPDVQRTLHRDDIRAVTESARGLTLYGPEFAEVIVVPREVVDYDGFRDRLIAWSRFDPIQNSGIAHRWPQFANSAALWLALLVLLTNNPWVITIGGPIVLVMCIVRLVRILSTSVLSFRTKLLNALVLGYLAFAIGIRLLVLGRLPTV